MVAFRDLDGLIETERVGHVCGSLDEMATAIQALDTRGRGDEMGASARRLVERQFSPGVIARQYLEFFAGL